MEFVLLREQRTPRYILRIGINYHGAQVQHVTLDQNGHLVGWNRTGDALGTSLRAKLRLAGHTIFPRDPDEQLKSDSKVGGGDVPTGRFVRIEFKVRGWLGKTRNLNGTQLEKDIDLLKDDRADLLVICLSETAHLKWRGEGPIHQANRRVGTARIAQILNDLTTLSTGTTYREFNFEGQRWASSTEKVVGSSNSVMPGAIHYVTLVWRRAHKLSGDIAPKA
ncbi:hypothetical protein [Curtobacterium poinsettiae]|uniref:hypothetical protein n=1 Tax=Curtobacterium poinsettiae TaxID=159612 RepID=UPI00217DD376|nr:hypothetical protein [Curtobacterium flaccumfaciens]MCS6577354.1 hypothetical protein [Curtobacterium flaccumfaciens]